MNATSMSALNPFKAALANGQRQIGFWLSMADAYLAEVSATAGFEWLLIDAEHAPNDVRSILAQLQAVAPYSAEAVVRPVNGDPALLKRLLDIGARNLLVPMIDAADQARACVAAVRYPPHGIRGVKNGEEFQEMAPPRSMVRNSRRRRHLRQR